MTKSILLVSPDVYISQSESYTPIISNHETTHYIVDCGFR